MHYSMRRLSEQIEYWRAEFAAARRAHSRLVPAIATIFALLVVVPFTAGIWTAITLRRGLPDEAAIGRMGEMDQATAVYDAADSLVFTIYKERRLDVPFENVAPVVVTALLAIEDQRFYDHRGFDLVRIASAGLANLRRGRASQGGSTITQQLARQSFLTPDKTIRRKLQELILAARIERAYTKSEILHLYLNKVYFGDGLYGIEAAAQGFFGKHASDLNLSEAALLAGLVKSPSSYAPTVSLERATSRRNLVLQVMFDSGVIDRAAWESARATKVAVSDALKDDEPYGQYFKEQVRRELVNRFGWQRVYQGGLRVYATLDARMQQAAEVAVAESLKSLDGRRQKLAQRLAKDALVPVSDPLQAALVAIDPHSGEVRAMVGGRDFVESHFNRAVQARRQPGSAFKPFVYAAALEAGYSPASMIENLNVPIDTLQGEWTPEDEHTTVDSMSLRAGLRTSSNKAAVRLLQDVGIPKTVAAVKAMGVGDVPSVPSLALGSGEVTLQSLTVAYAAFANQGEVPRPYLIRRVEDRSGEVLFSAEPSASRVITESTAYLMASMMADVINSGTAARARGLGFTLPAAGKTGTTNDFNDAWFVGFTPRLLAGVWVGFDQPHTILPRGFASDVAVPLWTAFMKAATKGDKPEWFTPPADVTTAVVCRLSGKLATEGCEHVEVIDAKGQLERRSMVYTEYFAKGTEPTDQCDLHPTRGFFGHIATIFNGSEKPTPPRIEETGLPPHAPTAAAAPAAEAVTQAAAAGQPEPPKKKRGFWSRVFGRNGGKNDRRDDSERRR
jgi:1A family penicillin-binding protein